MRQTLVISILLAGLSTGCPLAAMKQQHDAIAKAESDGQKNFAAAQAQARTDMYVIEPELWFCPQADDARANTRCDGGQHYDRNQQVTVIGQAPSDGLWASEIWDAQGSHPGFVLARALNELPDTAGLDTFVTEIDRRYPAGKRIPIEAVTYVDLVSQPKAYNGRVLLLRQPSGQMDNQDYGTETFTFTLPIPARGTGDQQVALAQFELHSPTFVAAFRDGTHSYSCGPDYCDEFVIVARLAGRTTDRTDELGNVVRLPVFTVVELADRFGTYQAD